MYASLKMACLGKPTKQSSRSRRRTKLLVLCIRLDKVAASANFLQHNSKDSFLFGMRLDGFQSILVMCKIKRVMDGLEQGLDVFITLILVQERLPSRRILHEDLVRKMTEMDVPWGLPKVNCGPSLRVGNARCGS
jgi:hypothetical protein